MSETYNRDAIDSFHRRIDEKLDEIKHQVEKTNGRVKSLEQWKAGIVGGLSVLTLLVVPVVIYIIKEHISLL